MIYDPVKLDVKVERAGEMVGFVKFWGREFFHYPIEYIDAFLLNTKGYWFVADTSFSHVYLNDPPTLRHGAILTESYDYLDVEHISFFPQLENLYEWLFSYNNYQYVPVVAQLTTPATYTWLLLFALSWALWRKNRPVLLCGGLLFCYLLTLLLGPCVQVRYQYALIVCVPLLLALIRHPSQQFTKI